MTDRKTKARGLGRGLSALMADVTATPDDNISGRSARQETTVPIEQVFANPDQPRRRFDQTELDDLASSIREKGIIQPLIVREKEAGKYEIVAGERRWRAAQQAQLHELPVLIRDYNDTEVLEVAIIENIQRADLNAIEEAAGYRQLMDRFGHTQEKLAEALGKSRSHIANLVRLLSLPEDVLDMVRSGQLSGGHARALVTAADPSALARKMVKEGMSVRGAEALVRRVSQAGTDEVTAKPAKAKPVKDADTQALENDLSAHLRMRVNLSHRPGQESGTLTISYNDLDQLDTLCRLLSGT